MMELGTGSTQTCSSVSTQGLTCSTDGPGVWVKPDPWISCPLPLLQVHTRDSNYNHSHIKSPPTSDPMKVVTAIIRVLTGILFRPDDSCKIGCSQNVKCLFLRLCFCLSGLLNCVSFFYQGFIPAAFFV